MTQGPGQSHLFGLHARGIDLNNENIVKPVDHQAREEITFAVNQAIKRIRVQAIAMLCGDCHSVFNQRISKRFLTIATHQPHGNQRMRIEISIADPTPFAGFNVDHLARNVAGQRVFFGIDLVTVDPQMAVHRPPLLAFL